MRGRTLSRSALGAAAVCLWLAGAAQAQVVNGNQWPVPRLTALTPAGGKAGTAFEVGFAGSDVEEPQSLAFSHPGIKGVAIVPPLPKPDPKAKPDPKKPAPKAPPITKFAVTIDKAVPPGFYDVRLVNAKGISNPRIFVVGELNEVAEKEPNNDVDQAQKVDLGTTITGNTGGGTDVDYTVFAGKKGQRILITCLANSIDSRLEPEMKLLDTAGKQLAYGRAQPDQDGVLDAILPADGDYILRLNHFTYIQPFPAGEYFYRLNISTGPRLEAVFPPMIEPGKAAQVTLLGRNLPGGQIDPAAVLNGSPMEKLTVSITAPADPLAQVRLSYTGNVPPATALLDGFEYRLPTPQGLSNPMLLTYAKAPVVLENDRNDTFETAQDVPLPCEIAGRIDKRGDRDWYAFTAKKGVSFIIETISHRLGAPTDMFVSVRNAKKAEMAPLDDNPETLSTKEFFTQSRDPAPYKFTAPEDGKYYLFVGNHLGDADPTHVYRIRISPEKPDFRLVVMPAEDFRPDSLVVGLGGLHHLQVFAQRLEGFRGEITLTAEGLPTGVTCTPQVLAPNMKSTNLVLQVADAAPANFTGEIKVTGTAVINGQKVVREARPATITWPVQNQQNIPTVTRLDRALVMAIRGKAPARFNATPEKAVVSLGDKIKINAKLTRIQPEFKGNFQFAPVPNDFPPGITFPAINMPPGKDDQVVELTVAPNTAPATYNLVFRGFAPISPDPKGKPVNTILPSNPITLTVLPKQVATLSVDNANPQLKLGGEVVVLVRVARQFDYADAFKVSLLPDNANGVTAAGAVIAAGQNDVKLALKVPANAAGGPRQNLTIRAIAVVNGNVMLNHDVKINVNVVK
ncbi:MAG: PPC domain-containing protein [Gemmataceae bacterium]|nr:PPC domain-containing protein [Gemmataceae bacterium]